MSRFGAGLDFGLRISAEDDTARGLQGALRGISSFGNLAGRALAAPFRVASGALATFRDINLGLRPLIAGLDRLITQGASIEVQQRAFQNLTGRSAGDAEKLARAAVEASNGTLQLAEAFQVANRGLSAGLDFNDILTAVSFISRQAVATGKDAGAALQTVLTGLSRGSTLFLDDFGVLVDGIEGVKRGFDAIKGKDAFESLSPAAQKAEIIRAAIAEMETKMGRLGITGRESVFIFEGIKNQVGDAVDRLSLAVARSESVRDVLKGVRDITSGIAGHLERGGSFKDLLFGRGGQSGGLFGILKGGVIDIGEGIGRGALAGILRGAAAITDLFAGAWDALRMRAGEFWKQGVEPHVLDTFDKVIERMKAGFQAGGAALLDMLPPGLRALFGAGGSASVATTQPAGWTETEERKFRDDFARIVNQRQAMGQPLNRDPDDPGHHYKYREAWRAGKLSVDDQGHFASQFKEPDHPNRFISGIDTIQPAGSIRLPQADLFGTAVDAGIGRIDRSLFKEATLSGIGIGTQKLAQFLLNEVAEQQAMRIAITQAGGGAGVAGIDSAVVQQILKTEGTRRLVNKGLTSSGILGFVSTLGAKGLTKAIPALIVADFIATSTNFAIVAKQLGDASDDMEQAQDFLRRTIDMHRKSGKVSDERLREMGLISQAGFPLNPLLGVGALAGQSALGITAPAGGQSLSQRLRDAAARIKSGGAGGSEFLRQFNLFTGDFPAQGAVERQVVDDILREQVKGLPLTDRGFLMRVGEHNIIERDLRRVRGQTQRDARKIAADVARGLRRQGFDVSPEKRAELEESIFAGLFDARTVSQRDRQRTVVGDISTDFALARPARGGGLASSEGQLPTNLLEAIKTEIKQLGRDVVNSNSALASIVSAGVKALAGAEGRIAAVGAK
jgi:hypothetical protein